MSPGALTRLAKSAENLFERVEHRTPDVTPPRPRSAPPAAPPTTGRDARGYRPNRTSPEWVYRADTRPAGEIFRDGFRAHPTPDGRYTYDLRQHQQGGANSANSGFVSTTGDERVTRQWGQDVLRQGSDGRGQVPTTMEANGQTWRLRESSIFRVQGNDHMIDAGAQDDAHRWSRMDGQHEFAAPNRIDPQNVESMTYTQRWERTHAGGVEEYPHDYLPDGRPSRQEYTQTNPGFDAQHPGYDPDRDPGSGWRRR